MNYWQDYFNHRVQSVRKRLGDQDYAERIVQLGADAIWYASPYGCQYGCPDGKAGLHKFSCPKAVNNAKTLKIREAAEQA